MKKQMAESTTESMAEWLRVAFKIEYLPKIDLRAALQDGCFRAIQREEGNDVARLAFKRALELAFDMGGNPKADKLFDLAWEYGHSCGFSEVLINYEDLLPLVK